MENGQQPEIHNDKPKNTILLVIIIVLGLAIVGIVVWFIISSSNLKKENENERSLREQAETDLKQREMQNELDAFDVQLASLENSREVIVDDSVKMELQLKYEEARLRIEKLQEELKSQKNLSRKEIEKLKAEIATLRNILTHYVEEINELKIENQKLLDEKESLKNKNQELSARVIASDRKNEELQQENILARKLNVSGTILKALNKKGKEEKKVSKAKQLMVQFSIPQNNTTPVGEKIFYLRIISPSGQLLGGEGSFEFEGASVQYTEKKIIEYGGEEIGGVTIYWDVNTALTPGQYTVELFADNFRLTSRTFDLK